MIISTADEKTPVDESPRINGRSCKTESCPAAGIMVQDLEQAEVEILEIVQRDAFDKKVKTLKGSQAQTEGTRKDRQCAKEMKALMKKTSSLNTLDPYLDVTGEYGGRITRVKLTGSLKNPFATSMRRPITAEGVSLLMNFVQMATGLLMVTQQLDASSQGVFYVTIYVVQRENRK